MQYSVYWDDERVIVVDAPDEEAVEALVGRHRCDIGGCEHCAKFSVIEGVQGLSLKPLRLGPDGQFKRGFLETAFASVFFFWPAILLWLFKVPQEPKQAFWPHRP